jgi:hypothetical protein
LNLKPSIYKISTPLYRYVIIFNFSQGPAYLVFVEVSSTLKIQDTCFIDNVVQIGYAPVWVKAESGLIDSANNYIDGIDGEPYCQYMFNQEQFKCFAPESSTCSVPACAASYEVYNARTDAFFADIVNGGTINSPPCSINIEAILPCASNGSKVVVQLLRNRVVVNQREEVEPFYLFGNGKADILPGTIASGTYTIQTLINGVVQPAPFTFTLAGRCIR